MMIWLHDSTGSLGVEDGIVRAEDVQHLLTLQDCRRVLAEQQEQLLQSARLQAEALLDQAQQQADTLLATARSDAERNARMGYEQGRRRAVQEWQARQIGYAIDRGQALRALHQKLAGIVTGAVERIVRTESREALYQRALDSVHGLTHGATALALRVNPEDYEAASNALAALPEPPHGVTLQVTADDSLQPGSCVFESDLGVLDASLHTQLHGLHTAMERAVRTAMAGLDGASSGGDDGYGQHDPQEQHDEQDLNDEQDLGEFADAEEFGDDPDEDPSHG
jgi:type III secretion protein L